MLRPVTALVLLATLGVPLLQHHHDQQQGRPQDRPSPPTTHASARFEHPVLRPAVPTPDPTRGPTDPGTGTLGPGDVVLPDPVLTPIPTHAPRAVIRPL